MVKYPTGKFCFLLLLVGTGVLTYRITKDDSTQTIPADVRTKPDSSALIQELESVVTNQRLKQTAIATIAFAGYVLAIGGPFTYLDKIIPGGREWQAYYGAVFLVLATLAVAVIAGGISSLTVLPFFLSQRLHWY
jgi:hypothetical protein